MLASLHISNFIIIDKLNIEFSKGLNIITGETGAGKSIIIAAIDLISGCKGNDGDIRKDAEEAVIEAVFIFNDNGNSIRQRLEAIGVVFDENIVSIKRIISKKGKNKIFINNSYITLSQVKEIVSELIDIHGQHENQRLLYPSNHLSVIDTYGDTSALANEVRYYYDLLQKKIKERLNLSALIAEATKEYDVVSYQVKEIEDAHIEDINEDESLKKEQKILFNRERLITLLQDVFDSLYNSDLSVTSLLGKDISILEDASQYDERLNNFTASLQKAISIAEDTALDLRDYLTRLECDSYRMEYVDKRLDLLNNLKKKYGGSLRAVLAYKQEIMGKNMDVESKKEELISLDKEILDIQGILKEKAIILAEQREETSIRFKRDVENILKNLGFIDAKIEIPFFYEYKDADDSFLEFRGRKARLTRNGLGSLEFLFSANTGEEPKPLSRVISGGELSRLMLAIKSLTVDNENIPVMVFDEIDTGVSGKIAEMIGRTMKYISKERQILCITHLPQIACAGDVHFKVEKLYHNSNRVEVKVVKLDEEQRIDEIARMSGGDKITETTLKHAREMLVKNLRYEKRASHTS